MNMITSVSNPLVKAMRSLKTHKARLETERHLAEGPKALFELLEHKIELETVFCTEAFFNQHTDALSCAEEAGASITLVSDNVLEAISDTRTPQGIVMRVVTPVCSGELPEGLVLALDGVQDPGNMGTLIRAADAFGASRVLLSEGCAEPYSPKAVRASAFSCYHLGIQAVSRLADALAKLQGAGFTLLAADLGGEERFPPLGEKVAVVVGSEGNGISAEVAEICTRVRLSMRGRAESLNVALAAGIFLYEVSNKIGQ